MVSHDSEALGFCEDDGGDGNVRIVSDHQSSSVTRSSGIPEDTNHGLRARILGLKRAKEWSGKVMLTQRYEKVDSLRVVFPKILDGVVVEVIVLTVRTARICS